MTNADDQLRGVDDPRLAIHATSSRPAWLWTLDGARILWANPVGAGLFGARNAAALGHKTFHPADPHRRQVARLGDRLPPSGAVRLERLRGFGAPLGALATCSCARLDFADGASGLLIVAAAPSGRAMPLVERLQRLIEGIERPVASFAPDGLFIGASEAARALIGFRDLTDSGLEAARRDALKNGRAELPIGIGHMVLQRVGAGADVALVAMLAPGPIAAEPTQHAPDSPQAGPNEAPAPETESAAAPADEMPASEPPIAPAPLADYEAPALTSEAPAEFTVIDDVAAAGGEPQNVAAQQPEPEPEPEPETTPEPTPELPLQSAAESELAPVSEPADGASAQPAVDPETPPDAIAEPIFEAAGQAAAESVEAHETPHDAAPADTADLEADVAADLAALTTGDAEESSPPASTAPSTPESVASPEPLPAETTPAAPANDVEPLPAESDAPAIAATPEPATPSPQPLEPAPQAPEAAPPPAWYDEPATEPRRNPLRFTWQLDADGHFSIGSDEFSRLIGPRTSAGFGRLWREIADVYGLDPDGRFAEAVASRRTWSGITLSWPVDGPDQRLAVEMSGLPAQDRDGRYIGYRGFGVCRDLDGLTRLAALRRGDHAGEAPARPLSADRSPAGLLADLPISALDAPPPSQAEPHPSPEELETPVDTPPNVLPFRPANDARQPALTPVENSAFNELARQLSARLDHEVVQAQDAGSDAASANASLPAETNAAETTAADPGDADVLTAPAPANDQRPDWLAPAITPAQGDASRDRVLLDLLPVGVLIYRLDRLLYANAPFLARMGYDSLHALEQAGGLDVLFVEPGVGGVSSSSEAGTPITIAPAAADDASRAPATGRLHTIAWDGEAAMALIFSAGDEPEVEATSIAAAAPSDVGHANAEELGAILDTTTDGVVMFDADGRINACNRSAEALFGIAGDELVQKTLPELFAPESHRALQDYFDAVKSEGAASLLDHGRDLLGQVNGGGAIPLAAIIGRTSADGPNYFAVFRDLSHARKTETELAQAKRQAEHAASAKADVLARLSHEIRAPLNAIIGFAEVMIEERFGGLGNERYGEYMKDIRASGERVLGIVNDLLDLSRIETGKMELSFAPLNLNELVEQCVGVMQPQANRERIIIRTSLAHLLPTVSADAQALRQVALNLIATSIHLANAGGQVIVSTALSDGGEVTLRVRDTGNSLNQDELAAAMQPFRSAAPTDATSEASGVSLSLTKALVEANRARFSIKTAPHSGTLIEVIFAKDSARA